MKDSEPSRADKVDELVLSAESGEAGITSLKATPDMDIVSR